MEAIYTSFTLVVFALAILAANASHPDIDTNPKKESRFLSLFTVTKFANTECTGSGGDTGTCYDYFSCLKGSTDATASGSCASGFGSCCTTKLSCGGRSSNNNTWLQSPGYPSTFNHHLTCSQTVTIDDSICQLRLDIVNLRLAYPASTGNCIHDELTVNHDNKFDKLCGFTSGTHFYLDVDPQVNEDVTFTFKTSPTHRVERSWFIKVAMIKCNSDTEVPRGCGQFFTGKGGTMKGFNQDGSTADNYVLSGLDYGICVRIEKNYCSIKYQEPGNLNWVPVCGDSFERPGLVNYPNVEEACRVGQQVGTTPVAAYTFSFLAPHIFWLDTTLDTTNTHFAGTGDGQGGYFITYTQNAC